jgi:hypothetical protein
LVTAAHPCLFWFFFEPLQWFGYDLSPNISCAGRLIPGSCCWEVLGPLRGCALVGGDWIMTTLLKGSVLVSWGGSGLPGVD